MTRILGNLGRLTEIAACRRQSAQWKKLTLAYLKLRPLHYPLDLRLRTGEKITLNEPTDLIIFWLVFVRCHYSVHASDRTIIDVGANIGIFTLYAAREAPGSKIVAVEPFPDTCVRLKALVESNRLQGRVTIVNCAVGAASSKGNMDIDPAIPSQYRRIYSEKTRGLNQRHRKMVEQANDGIPVETFPLHEILDRAGIGFADVMKMNIHGSEYDVLMGSPAAALRRCRRIVVQYHDMPPSSGITKRGLFEHMAKLGFRLLLDRVGSSAGLAEFELTEFSREAIDKSGLNLDPPGQSAHPDTRIA
jgi:FkbM family methyltransferase